MNLKKKTLQKIPSNKYREKIKIENLKAKKHFKYISSIVLLIIKSLLTRRKYTKFQIDCIFPIK